MVACQISNRPRVTFQDDEVQKANRRCVQVKRLRDQMVQDSQCFWSLDPLTQGHILNKIDQVIPASLELTQVKVDALITQADRKFIFPER